MTFSLRHLRHFSDLFSSPLRNDILKTLVKHLARHWPALLFLSLILVFIADTASFSQTTSDVAIGLSPYAQYAPSGIDNVNPLNGNLYLKLPVVGFPQRGGRLRLNFYVFYNDKQWHLSTQPICGTNPLSPGFCLYTGTVAATWTLGYGPSSNNANAGAYVARDQYVQYETLGTSSSAIYGQQGSNYSVTTGYAGYYAQTPDGASHLIGDSYSQTCQGVGGVCPANVNGLASNTYYAADATGFDPYGHDSDGISYGLLSGIMSGTASNGIPATVSDPNNNQITATSTGWTDTMGRGIPGSAAGPGFWPQQLNSVAISAPDLIPGVPMSPSQLASSPCPSGTSAGRIWTVPGSQSYGNGQVSYFLCYRAYQYTTNFSVQSQIPNWKAAWASVSEATGQTTMLTAIVLPDGSSYSFDYDSYLSLIHLGLPSGATISYTWQNVPFSFAVPPSMAASTTPVSRALKTRTVAPGGGQPSSTTTYHWLITPITAPSRQISAYSVVTDPEGNDVEYPLTGADASGSIFLNVNDLGSNSYNGCGPHDVANDSVCAPSGGTLMLSTTNTLTAIGSGGAAQSSPYYPVQPAYLPTVITTTMPVNGTTISKQVVQTLEPPFGTCNTTEYNAPGTSLGGTYALPVNDYVETYTPCFSTAQIATTAQYDWGTQGSNSPGPLLRTDTTTYLWQNSASYLSANQLTLVDKNVVTDGKSLWAGETDYGYDQSPSPAGVHGNQTSTTRYSNASTTVVSAFQYNTSGVLTSSIDGDLTQTLYSNLACNNSLPQTVTEASGSTSTQPESVQYTYDCNTGNALSVTDPNSVKTQNVYNDPLGRLTLTKRALGTSAESWTSISYPSTTQRNTASDQIAKGDGLIQDTVTYDGLHRVIHAIRPGSVEVDTTYDPLGRVQSVSNPYLSGGAATSETTFAYDVLGRKTMQCQPDNGTGAAACTPGKSFQQWIYSGNQTTFKDENQNAWTRTVDGLGRLVGVVEPGSLNTSYSYDPLGNLLCADQWGTSTAGQPCKSALKRSFTYDSLSRLLTSANPETGTLCYGLWSGSNCINGYDANGNLLAKTDARGITTRYSYDALNRLLAKTYLNDPTGTASSCFQYDTSSLVTGTTGNLVGRLTNSWTQKSACPLPASPPLFYSNSAILSRHSVLAYDAMGRVLNEQQCTRSNCASGTPYTPAYSYDLAGNAIALANGIASGNAAMNFTNCYDSAGHLSLVASGNVPCSTAPTASALLFSAPSYSPHGGLTSATFGTGLQLTRTYDSRLRVVSETDIGASVESPTTGSAVVAIPGSEQIH